MATIGTFTAQGDGYTGSIKTLTLNVKQAVLRPNEKTDDKAPDFRIFAGQTEFGAPGRRRASRTASTSRSSSTIPASRRRSTPPWSRSRAGTA